MDMLHAVIRLGSWRDSEDLLHIIELFFIHSPLEESVASYHILPKQWKKRKEKKRGGCMAY